MLQLFPVFKKRMLLHVAMWIAFLAVSIILYPGVPMLVVFLAAIIGTLVLMFIQAVNATNRQPSTYTVRFRGNGPLEMGEL